MSKTIDGVIGFVGTEASNYIKQINAGGTNHDIAVQNGITFFNGDTEVSWDGKQAVEVVIPTLADIVSNPVVFAGTVDANGNITWVEGKGSTPQTGYLVYIQAPCTFGGQNCEAGDMAVYDGSAWRVIQGENQVSLASNALTLTSTPQTAITVEGQDLTLAVDYTEVADVLSVDKNDSTEISVLNGKVSVASVALALSKEADTKEDITSAVSFDLPSALADGTVTISNKVLASGDFTFTSGSFPTVTKNSAATLSTSHNLSIGVSASDNGDYVTSVSAVGGVTLVTGNNSQNDIAYVASLSAATGTSFVTGLHSETAADEGKTAAFEIPGAVSVTGVSTFVTGLGSTEAATGDVVTSVGVGAVTIGASSANNVLVTGLSGEGSTVLTGVSFGDVTSDATRSWFLSGLTAGNDVVTGISVGEVTLVASNGGGSPAIVSATVSDHVLSFSTSNFQTPVAISQASTTVETSGFSTAGVKLDSNWTSASDTLTFGGINQAATTVSFKEFATDSINVSLGSATKYFYDKAEDHAYEAVMGYSKLSLTDATFTKGSPVLENTTITVNVPADTYVIGLSNDGVLPSLTIGDPSATISGTVGTSLTTSSISFLAVNSTKKTVVTDLGAITIVSGADGDVEVAVASNYDVENATVTIAADAYVTNVKVDGSNVTVNA